jgi:hypothetical protein
MMHTEAEMTTITLPPDLERRLAEEASRHGTTPEGLAVAALRRLYPPTNGTAPAESLLEYLAGHVGTVERFGGWHAAAMTRE